MIDSRFVLVGALLLCLGGFSYLRDTLRGSVQPNRVTWFLWALAPLVAFAAQVGESVGIVALPTFIVGFIPLLILGASFFNPGAHWQMTRLDVTCGVLSLAGLALWAITKDADLAILLAILADALAAIPTLAKAYTAPESENDTLFWFGLANAAIGLLVVQHWHFAEYAFPAYLLVINFAMASTIRLRLSSRVSVASTP
jgi:hypothetical protein